MLKRVQHDVGGKEFIAFSGPISSGLGFWI